MNNKESEKNIATATSTVYDENLGVQPNRFEDNQSTPQIIDKTTQTSDKTNQPIAKTGRIFGKTERVINKTKTKSESLKISPIWYSIGGLGLVLVAGGTWWLVRNRKHNKINFEP